MEAPPPMTSNRQPNSGSDVEFNSRMHDKDYEGQEERHLSATDADKSKSARVLELLAEMQRKPAEQALQPAEHQGNDGSRKFEAAQLGKSTADGVITSTGITSAKANTSGNHINSHASNRRKRKSKTQDAIPETVGKKKKMSSNTVESTNQRVGVEGHSRAHLGSKQNCRKTSKMSGNGTSGATLVNAEEDWLVVVVDPESSLPAFESGGMPSDVGEMVASGGDGNAGGVTKMVSVKPSPGITPSGGGGGEVASGVGEVASGVNKMATGVGKMAAGVCNTTDGCEENADRVTKMVSVEGSPDIGEKMEGAVGKMPGVPATSASTNSSSNEIKRKRIRDKHFSCSFCNRKYDCKARLIAHLGTHTGEKPFACDECNFRTVRKYNLTAHKLTHVKRFACGDCGFGTNSKISFQVHRRNHEALGMRATGIGENAGSVGKVAGGVSVGKVAGDVSVSKVAGDVTEIVSVECSPDIGGVVIGHPAVLVRGASTSKVTSSDKMANVDGKMADEGIKMVCSPDIKGVMQLAADNVKAAGIREKTTSEKMANVGGEITDGGSKIVSVECSPDIEGVMNLTTEDVTVASTRKTTYSDIIGGDGGKMANAGFNMVSVNIQDIEGVAEIAARYAIFAPSTSRNTWSGRKKTSTGKTRVRKAPEKIFTCAVCNHNFNRKWCLIIHLRKHTGEKPFACNKCNYRCNRKHHLVSHKLTHTLRYACENCRFQTDSEMSLQLHIVKNHYRPQMVPGIRKTAGEASKVVSVECSPDIEGVVKLAAEDYVAKKRKARVREGIFTCAVCDRKYDRKSRLIIHLRAHTGEKPYACDKCNYRGTSKVNLTNHKLTHSAAKPFACDECPFQGSSKRSIQRHKKTHSTEKPFACDVCDYRSSRKHNLTEHKLTHSDVKRYSCDECRFQTNSKKTMDVHTRNHRGEKPFACDICDYRCSSSGMLTAHKVSHTEERPYSCQICAYRGKDSRALNEHVKTHTNEKTFKCPYCNYACYRSVKLTAHIRSHTGERPYACDKCDYASSTATYLKVHMRTHTGEKPFACNVCDFKCRQASHLKVHMTDHEGQKLFSCETCDYSTSIASHFKDHIKIHSEEKPYSCDSCGRRFSIGTHLMRHMLSVHRNMPFRCDACGYECNVRAAYEDHLRNCDFNTNVLYVVNK